MSNEEFEKKAEFIVEQQAQFAAKIGQLEDIVARLAKAPRGHFEATDERASDVDERILVLVDAQIRTDENVKQTNENLRNLIVVVDRYFSGKQN